MFLLVEFGCDNKELFDIAEKKQNIFKLIIGGTGLLGRFEKK